MPSNQNNSQGQGQKEKSNQKTIKWKQKNEKRKKPHKTKKGKMENGKRGKLNKATTQGGRIRSGLKKWGGKRKECVSCAEGTGTT